MRSSPLTSDVSVSALDESDISVEDKTANNKKPSISALTADVKTTPLPPNVKVVPLTVKAKIFPLIAKIKVIPFTAKAKATPFNPNATVTPLTPDATVIPLTTEAKTSPLTTDAKTSPLTTDAKTSPLTTNAKVFPLAADAKTSPLTTNAKVFPLAADAKTSPLTTNAKVFPLADDAKTVPLTTNAKVFPLAADAKTSPLTTNAKVFPLAADAKTVPLTTNAKVFPLAADAKTSPLTTNAKFNPFKADVPINSVSANAEVNSLTANTKIIPVTPDAKVTPFNASTEVTALTGKAKIASLTSNPKVTSLRDNADVTSLTGNGKITPLTDNANVTALTDNAKVTALTGNGKITPLTDNANVTALTDNAKVTALTGNGKITPLTDNGKITALTDNANVTALTGNGKITSLTDNANVTALTDIAKVPPLKDNAEATRITTELDLMKESTSRSRSDQPTRAPLTLPTWVEVSGFLDLRSLSENHPFIRMSDSEGFNPALQSRTRGQRQPPSQLQRTLGVTNSSTLRSSTSSWQPTVKNVKKVPSMTGAQESLGTKYTGKQSRKVVKKTVEKVSPTITTSQVRKQTGLSQPPNHKDVKGENTVILGRKKSGLQPYRKHTFFEELEEHKKAESAAKISRPAVPTKNVGEGHKAIPKAHEEQSKKKSVVRPSNGKSSIKEAPHQAKKLMGPPSKTVEQKASLPTHNDIYDSDKKLPFNRQVSVEFHRWPSSHEQDIETVTPMNQETTLQEEFRSKRERHRTVPENKHSISSTPLIQGRSLMSLNSQPFNIRKLYSTNTPHRAASRRLFTLTSLKSRGTKNNIPSSARLPKMSNMVSKISPKKWSKHIANDVRRGVSRLITPSSRESSKTHVNEEDGEITKSTISPWHTKTSATNDSVAKPRLSLLTTLTKQATGYPLLLKKKNAKLYSRASPVKMESSDVSVSLKNSKGYVDPLGKHLLPRTMESSEESLSVQGSVKHGGLSTSENSVHVDSYDKSKALSHPSHFMLHTPYKEPSFNADLLQHVVKKSQSPVRHKRTFTSMNHKQSNETHDDHTSINLHHKSPSHTSSPTKMSDLSSQDQGLLLNGRDVKSDSVPPEKEGIVLKPKMQAQKLKSRNVELQTTKKSTLLSTEYQHHRNTLPMVLSDRQPVEASGPQLLPSTPLSSSNEGPRRQRRTSRSVELTPHQTPSEKALTSRSAIASGNSSLLKKALALRWKIPFPKDILSLNGTRLGQLTGSKSEATVRKSLLPFRERQRKTSANSSSFTTLQSPVSSPSLTVQDAVEAPSVNPHQNTDLSRDLLSHKTLGVHNSNVFRDAIEHRSGSISRNTLTTGTSDVPYQPATLPKATSNDNVAVFEEKTTSRDAKRWGSWSPQKYLTSSEKGIQLQSEATLRDATLTELQIPSHTTALVASRPEYTDSMSPSKEPREREPTHLKSITPFEKPVAVQDQRPSIGGIILHRNGQPQNEHIFATPKTSREGNQFAPVISPLGGPAARTLPPLRNIQFLSEIPNNSTQAPSRGFSAIGSYGSGCPACGAVPICIMPSTIPFSPMPAFTSTIPNAPTYVDYYNGSRGVKSHCPLQQFSLPLSKDSPTEKRKAVTRFSPYKTEYRMAHTSSNTTHPTYYDITSRLIPEASNTDTIESQSSSTRDVTPKASSVKPMSCVTCCFHPTIY